MRFGVLGPVEVTDGKRTVDLPAAKERAMLALLVCHANAAVPVDRLIDALWGPAPPRTAAQNVRQYVYHLRRALGDADRIRHRPPGYALTVAPGEVDADRFETLAEEGRRMLVADVARAADILRQALALWRGPAYAGLDDVGTLREEAARLEELRWAALEARIEADLALDRHAPLVAELSGLVAEQPLRERWHALLMRALYRSGRQAEALAVYRDARALFADELGLEPGVELQGLEQVILRGEADHAAASPVPATHIVVPALLPLDLPGFIGREAHIRELDALVEGTGRRPAATAIAAISGTAGVGKTTLAVHWAHRVAALFPDGQLHVNLRGFDPGGRVTTPSEAIRGFLDAFGVSPQRIPAELDAQAGLYRSLLAGKRVLVVLDNARDADQVRPLLPGTRGCLVVVTSRNQLTSLVAAHAAHPVILDLLTADEARDLLARRLGASRVAADRAAADTLVARCARLPLALAVVAARAATRPSFPLTAIADEVGDTRADLDAFTAGDALTEVRAVFSWSYRTLGEQAARLFRFLALHPGPDLTVAAAASLTGVPPRRVRSALAELTEAHLLLEHTPGRYGFHDLLRAYAAELTRAEDPEADRRTAINRMLDHYLHTGRRAAVLLSPHRSGTEPDPPEPGVTPEEPADHAAAMAWFAAEHRVLLAVIQRSADEGFDAHTCRLAWTGGSYFDWQGHWQDWAETQLTSLAAARRLADRSEQALAYRGLGRAYSRLGRLDDAHDHLQQAIDLYREVGDQIGEATVCLALAFVLEWQGRPRDVLEATSRALELFRAAGHQGGEANALSAVGWCHAQLGDYEQAVMYCEQALTLVQKTEDLSCEAAAWSSLGYAHHHLGQYARAVDCYRRSVDVYLALGDPYYQAVTLSHLGDALYAADDPASARDAWRQTLEILDPLDHHNADKIRDRIRRVLAAS